MKDDQLFPTANLKKHPAKYPDAVLKILAEYVTPEMRVLDPFAGTGRIHQLNAKTVGVELEPEWANYNEKTVVGDALKISNYFGHESFDAIATSPTYGNRLADSHVVNDRSKRLSYTVQLERKPTDGSSAILQWGEEYKTFHRKAWDEAQKVLKPNGLFLLNISNHIRKFVEQPVSEWHLSHCLHMGFKLLAIRPVETPRLRFGENWKARCAHEFIFVMKK